MSPKPVRLAARAVIVHDDRILLVNAWANGQSRLLCAPGGGVEPGASLPDNLTREIHEETGLHVTVGAVCLVNEFHDPRTGFHQVEVFFRCAIKGDTQIAADWQDPERVVTDHIWAKENEMPDLLVKPDSLAGIAFRPEGQITYDPLEEIVM
ncbi:NUDIX domain-containing protein [Roseobacter sp.]|uniref:NUDIX domain-containing protein n=1 Tax=Roseobacter sp. TaxID=1907202 RepID=UPI0032994223